MKQSNTKVGKENVASEGVPLVEYLQKMYLWSTFRGHAFGGVPLEDVPVEYL